MRSPRDTQQRAGSPTTDTFERDRQRAREIAQQQARDYAQSFGGASGLHCLLQPQYQVTQALPPIGLYAVNNIHPHPHQGNRSSGKRKRVEFVDLTTDDDSPLELQHKTIKRPRLSPPKSAPPQLSPAKKRQPADALRKKQQREAQSKADEQLARELQEADQCNSKTRRLRNKTSSPGKRGERGQRQQNSSSASPEKHLGKKLSVYEEFQRIEEEAAQGKQRQSKKRNLRSLSPEKSTKRTHRGNTPEERRASKQTARALRSNSPEKQPGKKLSVYEEFQRIQQEAVLGEDRQTRKRTLRSASPEKVTKRTRRGSTPEERRASKETTRVNMNRANIDELSALQKQFQAQPRASASAEDDRRKMPPPPPPKNSSNHPMLPPQISNGALTSQNTQPKPSNPLSLPHPRLAGQDFLHSPQNARITKQSYHTAHKQPYSTQEFHKRAQLYEADIRAQERARDERQARDDYIFNHTRHREALQNGVHMLDVENESVAFDMCQYFAGREYRYGHLPSMNPDLPLPSIENVVDLTNDESGAGCPAHDEKGAGYPANDSRGEDAHPTTITTADDDDAAATTGPSNVIDLTAPTTDATNEALAPLFDTPVPYDKYLDAAALPPVTGEDPFELDAGQPGMFLEPYLDEDGCLRAPDPEGFTPESALVEELLQYAEEENTSSFVDEASGWV